MTDNNHIDDSTQKSVQGLETPEANLNPRLSERRRSLIKGAAAVTPIMMTVASRPVLGAQCTPSAWVSGNLSDHSQDRSCGGYSPGYWKTHPEQWVRFKPGTCKYSSKFGTCKEYKSDGTPFHRFSRMRRRGVFPGHYYRDRTLMQVLWLKGHEDPYQLGAHIVAALLNAASKPDYGMSVRDVIRIYGQLARRGYYQPSAGDPMSPQEVVMFIQNTFV